jgi:hypothetical protein
MIELRLLAVVGLVIVAIVSAATVIAVSAAARWVRHRFDAGAGGVDSPRRSGIGPAGAAIPRTGGEIR